MTVNCHELAQLLAALRGASMLHQTHHWRSKGLTSYSDHLLFERLYNGTVEFVDSVAERAMGLGGADSLAFDMQIEWLNRAVSKLPSGSTQDEMASGSLSAVTFILTLIPSVREALEARGELSAGTDNMLQSIEDKHEEFSYLLKSRLA